MTAGEVRGTAARAVERPPPGATWDPLTALNANAVALGLSKDPNPKTTLLLFRPGGAAPCAAAKLPSTSPSRFAVQREAGFLLDVHRRFSGAVLRTIPRRLTAFEACLPAGSMVVQALPGTPLSVIYTRRGHLRSDIEVGRDFACVSNWLRDLEAATTQSSGPVDLGAPILDALAARYPCDLRAARVLRALEPITRRFSTFQGPKTVVHGDLWLGNILVDGVGVSGVIDWESAQLTGEPLRDVARFALTYALYLDRRTRPGRRIRGHPVSAGTWGVGIAYILTGDGWFPNTVRGFLCRAMARLGTDPAAWPKLLLMGLADVAATADDDGWAHRHLVLLDQLKDVVR
jgi:hypothetical protein